MAEIYLEEKDKNVAGYVLYKNPATNRWYYEYDSDSDTYSRPVAPEDALKLFAMGAVAYDDGTYVKITNYDGFAAGCIDPLAGLAIDFDIDDSVDLFGKSASDLQSGVYLEKDEVHGLLYWQDDYTGFSGNPDEQKGVYLALHAEVPDVDDVTIKVNNVTLDADGIIVLIIRNKDNGKVVVTASKSGCEDETRTYYLRPLQTLAKVG